MGFQMPITWVIDLICRKQDMTTIDKLLLLIRSALWGEVLQGEVSKEDLPLVMNLAKEQTVYGLAYDAISQHSGKGQYDKRQAFEAYARTQKIKKQNVLIDKELKEMVQLFDENNVDYLVVKGQTYSILYPKPEVRMAGDIDFLIHNAYSEVKEVVERLYSVNLPDKMIEKEIEFKHASVPFELHTSLRTYALKRHQKVWDNLVEKEWQEPYFVEVNGVKVRTLSPTLNAAYVFIHLFFHFMREGVALRQLCDWAMVLHHYQKEIDREALSKMLSDLNLSDAYQAFGTILTDCLGLPVYEFPLPLGNIDRKWQHKIMEDIFGGGNFGKLHHQSKNSWRFKLETLQLVIRNALRYYGLCPSEIGGMIPRLVKGNLKILFS